MALHPPQGAWSLAHQLELALQAYGRQMVSVKCTTNGPVHTLRDNKQSTRGSCVCRPELSQLAAHSIPCVFFASALTIYCKHVSTEHLLAPENTAVTWTVVLDLQVRMPADAAACEVEQPQREAI